MHKTNNTNLTAPTIIKDYINRLKTFFVLMLLGLPWISVNASNFTVEQNIADQLAKNNPSMAQEWLTIGDKKFLGLYLNANIPKAHGGIILLHGMAAHPDWPNVISPLRTKLPEHGWATLSLQMPILGQNTTPKQYAPLLKEVPARITAAIELMHAKGIYNIIILGHGLGATMAAYYLASPTQSASALKAFIGIGLGLNSHIDQFKTAQYIVKIKLPVYDLFGSQDMDSVKRSAQTRLLAARSADNRYYRQTSILGSDHFFSGLDDLLVNRVKSWLNKFAPSVKLNVNELDESKKGEP